MEELFISLHKESEMGSNFKAAEEKHDQKNKTSIQFHTVNKELLRRSQRRCALECRILGIILKNIQNSLFTIRREQL